MPRTLEDIKVQVRRALKEKEGARVQVERGRHYGKNLCRAFNITGVSESIVCSAVNEMTSEGELFEHPSVKNIATSGSTKQPRIEHYVTLSLA